VVRLEAQITNPRGTRFVFDVELNSYPSLQKDATKVSEATLNITSDDPVLQMSEVVLYDGGEVLFHGYVEKYSVSSEGNKRLSCKGVENLLQYRFNPMALNACWDTGSFALKYMFYDDISETPGGLAPYVGQLAIANGLFPPGLPYTIYDATNNIVQFAGMGRKSHAGNAPIAQITRNAIQTLTEGTELDDLISSTEYYYRNDDNLFVRPTTTVLGSPASAWFYQFPWKSGIIAHNAFDTKVRLHPDCDDTVKYVGGMMLNEHDVRSVMLDLVSAHECVARWIPDFEYSYFYFEAA